MTVNELINRLLDYPSNAKVVIPGYEGGFDNVEVESRDIVLDTNWDGKSKIAWYNGRHDYFYAGEGGKPTSVVVIGRGE